MTEIAPTFSLSGTHGPVMGAFADLVVIQREGTSLVLRLARASLATHLTVSFPTESLAEEAARTLEDGWARWLAR